MLREIEADEVSSQPVDWIVNERCTFTNNRQEMVCFGGLSAQCRVIWRV